MKKPPIISPMTNHNNMLSLYLETATKMSTPRSALDFAQITVSLCALIYLLINLPFKLFLVTSLPASIRSAGGQSPPPKRRPWNTQAKFHLAIIICLIVTVILIIVNEALNLTFVLTGQYNYRQNHYYLTINEWVCGTLVASSGFLLGLNAVLKFKRFSISSTMAAAKIKIFYAIVLITFICSILCVCQITERIIKILANRFFFLSLGIF